MAERIRLDIGAGHKREEGWTTLDNATKRALDGATVAEFKPDIECDITKIPLPDNYADEVRAIHVIEHFWAWEALDVLKEWIRVLKPGGEIALECPCLDKVLQLAQVPDCPPQYVHWALYGDPKYKEPAMMHRWAYTRLQLAKIMAQAGLIGIRQEPPRFHVLIRDMRMVGVKPMMKPGLILQ